jgi:hypothetical protein
LKEVWERIIVSSPIKSMEKKKGGNGGIIAVCSSFLGRYREFDICVNNTVSPEGTIIVWKLGIDIARNFNQCIQMMLDQGKDWIWMLGDDHVFSPQLLSNLLTRNKDVIVPLCLSRSVPILPVLRDIEKHQQVAFDYLKQLGNSPMHMLEKNIAVGNAGMLIKKEVFEQIPAPWMEQGQINSECGSYDLYWCKKLHDAGVDVYLDMENTIGHLTHVALWPGKNTKGQWGYSFKFHDPSAVYQFQNATKQEQKIPWKSVFNEWRKKYDTADYKTHQALYGHIFREFTKQDQGNIEWTETFFANLSANLGDIKVLELGGWTGDMARKMLRRFPQDITAWENYEICKQTQLSVGVLGYKHIILEDFFWKVLPEVKMFNVLYLSHVIEHMKFGDFQVVVNHVKEHIQGVYIDAPIGITGTDWTDYIGTHILEVGWVEISSFMQEIGFKHQNQYGENCYSFYK